MAPALPEAVGRRAASLIRRHALNAGLSWEVQRRRMATAMAMTKAPAGVNRVTSSRGGVPVEILSPAGRPPAATLVHVHGGGFTVGSALMGLGWGGALSLALDLEVVLPDYRLAPEHPFPAALDDVTAVVTEVLATSVPGRVALSGDSAGGNLALIASLDAAQRGTPPASLLLLSPWLDLSVDRTADRALLERDPMLDPAWLAASAQVYAPGGLRDPRVSPLLGSLDGLPPTLVQGGSDDVLAPDALRLAALRPDAVSLSVATPLWHDFALQVGALRAADEALVLSIDHLARTLDLTPSTTNEP
jgi:acetyl esterase/lipase